MAASPRAAPSERSRKNCTSGGPHSDFTSRSRRCRSRSANSKPNGVALFVRSTRRVELTPAGEDYLRRTVSILDAVDVAGRAAQRIAEGRAGTLAIGCVGSATYSFLPQLVRAMREELPDVEVSVRDEMLAPAQVDALTSGEIDIGLLRPPVSSPGLHVETVRRDRLFVALPADHRLAADLTSPIDAGRLRDSDFVTHAGGGKSVMNGVVAAVCARAGFVPQARHEVEETSTLVTLVAAGVGVAVVPEPTAALGIAGVVYRPLSDAGDIDLVVACDAANRTPLVDHALRVLRAIV